MTLSDLGLEPSIVDLLAKGKVTTVEGLTEQTPRDLRKIAGFARRHLNQVRAALKKHHLALQE